ncbi:MAG: hypothetical protein JOY64_13230 [Alphaproteobacteria bacterium]|nr:hypothetical protein [Alphaproteobacteria bacterium]
MKIIEFLYTGETAGLKAGIFTVADKEDKHAKWATVDVPYLNKSSKTQSFALKKYKIYCEESDSENFLTSAGFAFFANGHTIYESFVKLAQDLVQLNDKKSLYVLIGQSLKMLKWALKLRCEVATMALTVSSIEAKDKPTAEFLKYLTDKLKKHIPEGETQDIILVDYASEGRSLTVIKRLFIDLKGDADCASRIGKVTSVAYIAEGESAASKLKKADIDKSIRLEGDLAQLIGFQGIKDFTGRNKIKNEYSKWSSSSRGADETASKYQQLKAGFKAVPAISPETYKDFYSAVAYYEECRKQEDDDEEDEKG